MKKFLTILLSIFILSGCVSKPVIETRVTTDLKSYEFNDLSSTYMPRPTFVAVEQYRSTRFLHVKVDSYGQSTPSNNTDKHIAFNVVKLDEYISMIDKYLKWESLAVERADKLDKHIGTVDAVSELSFDFYSANSTNHYLVITTVTGGYHQWDTYFPKEEAEKLKQLLTDFKDGKLQPVDTDIYT